MNDLPLTHGWLPIVIQAVAVLVIVVVIWRTPSRFWLHWILLGITCGAALAGLTYWFIHSQALADGPAVPALWVWVAATGLVVVLAITNWRTTRWGRRSAALAAIPLCVLCVAMTVNAWTGYLPTVGAMADRVTGAHLPNEVDEATVQDMLRRGERPTAGIVVSVKIPDDASGFRHRDELVYLPPAWFASNPPPALPAIVMAGGEFGTPRDWPTTGEARATADAFADKHGGNAPILVFVDTSGEFINDTECVNGPRGNAADHLIKGVVPYVVAHFGARPQAAHWGFAGWSAGGTCALTTTLMHPDMFSTFLDIDGQMGPNAGSKTQTVARLFGSDLDAYLAFDPQTVMARHGPYDGVAAWFAVSGPGQPTYRPSAVTDTPTAPVDPDSLDTEHDAVAQHLCSMAGGYGIECAVVPGNGGHSFTTAARVFADALPWLAGRLGTPDVPAVALPGAPR
ncbi:esterase family protein [Mycobacterium hackensackense]|uniref:alpha/beta hydrolase n=1 Tax=Mycobacterium hackensackense TaxID=228909 RepID=UPI002265CF34|nr:alpha/beta hydrolase-fold protein [Mycobacterium hackensackense]MCV7251012.1 esterase family protein [Mycobacterium hackensackense]